MDASALTEFQRQVARLFFSLPASDGYLLVLAQMLTTLDRFSDEELPTEPELVATMRGFFAAWAVELAAV